MSSRLIFPIAAVIIAAAGFFTGCSTASQLFGQQEELVNITIAATGNMSGDVLPAVSALRHKQLQREYVVVLDLGNMTAGSMLGFYSSHVDTQTTHVQSLLMRYAGYDAALPGSRDLGSGSGVYQRIRQQSGVPWLAANIVNRNTGGPYVTPYRIIRKGDVTIALLGLVHPDAAAGIPERVIPGVSILDLSSSARNWVEIIRERENPDVIIGIISAWDDSLYRHTAQDHRQWEMRDYREEVFQAVRSTAGLTIVFTNFSDQPGITSVTDREGREVPIVTIGHTGGFAGSADMELAAARGSSQYIVRNIHPRILDLGEYEADLGAAALLEPYLSRTEKFAQKPVGQLEETLLSRESFFMDAPMTALIHTLQLSLTNAHVSFASVPAYNDQLAAGTVSPGDIFQLFPNESFIFSIRMTGREIKDYLEYSYSRWFNTMRGPYDSLIRFSEKGTPDVPYYQYDSAGGIRYTVDVTKQPGERIEIIEFSDGRPFRLQDTYITAVNSFRMIGGGGHLLEGAGISTGEAASRIVSASTRGIMHNLIRWFEANKVFVPHVQPQWYAVPESWGAAGRLNDYPSLFGQFPFE